MLFEYKAVDGTNVTRTGTVEANNVDGAISAVQERGYTIISIEPIDKKTDIFNIEIDWFQSVSTADLVIISRQIATLFTAQVSALRIFRLLAEESDKPLIRKIFADIAEQLQSGSSISRALSVHDEVFSNFYINLVKAGEESGNIDKSFNYLADYLDRNYQLMSKAKNALIYPAFVIGVFLLVMTLMLTMVIPKIAKILTDSGQELPIYTKIVIGLSDFMSNYIGILLFLFAIIGYAGYRFVHTPAGKRAYDEMKLTIPYVGDLNRKIYLTRICDNLSTMLASGVPMIDALEVTSKVVDNEVFREIIDNTIFEVKGGRSFADAISEYDEIPGVLTQMAKVGEESGNISDILRTLAKFYEREVHNAVDTLIGLIEPAMILLLGLGVGTLLASVLMPIYNLTNTI